MSAWYCKSHFCFAARSAITSSTAGLMPQRRTRSPRPALPRLTTLLSARRLATIPGSVNEAPASPVAKSSGSRLRAPCSTIPRFSILDEATSSVDTESEKAIQEALRVLTRGRTTLAIAHRLSTLRDSDRIFVFDEGRLIEEGTHNQLLRLDGKYARMVKIQSQIARETQLETALNDSANDLGDEPDYNPAADSGAQLIDFAPHWLEPDTAQVRAGRHESLEVEMPDGTIYRGVFAVRCFPATLPEDFISLRTWDRDGKEHELAIVRHLGRWSARDQELLRARAGAALLPPTDHGHRRHQARVRTLLFRVRTEQGSTEFTMRWTQSQAQDFGSRGKVLMDLEDNRFLLPISTRCRLASASFSSDIVYW